MIGRSARPSPSTTGRARIGLSRAVASIALSILCGCSVAPMNAPLSAPKPTGTETTPATAYDFAHLQDHGSDELLVFLAFSGGGKRSAAFSYGALNTLQDTQIPARQTVADFAELLKQRRCAIAPQIDGHPCDDVQGFFDHIALADIADSKIRKRLEAIPTGLTMSDEDVDLLVDAGRSSLERSKVLNAFIHSLDKP